MARNSLFLFHRSADVVQKKNTIQTSKQLFEFLSSVLPKTLPPDSHNAEARPQTAQQFIDDVSAGLRISPMSLRLTPHTLSLVNWSQPVEDPLRRQFIPLASTMQEDHPMLSLDSLHEESDAPVKGLVHRYPDKVLFLGKAPSLITVRFGSPNL